MVMGPDGTDTLTSIEQLKFADATLNVVDDGNPLFDSLYYFSRNTDVFFAGANALDHFNAHGWHEGRDPNGFFDTSGYLAVNKDVAAAGVNPLEHYHQSGWNRARSVRVVRHHSLPHQQSGCGRGRHRSARALSGVRHGRRPQGLCGGRPDPERVRRAVLSVPQSGCGGGRRRSAHALQRRSAGTKATIRTRCSTRPAISRTTPTWRQQVSIRWSTTSSSAGGRGATRRRRSTRSVIWRRTRTSQRPASIRCSISCTSASTKAARHVRMELGLED